MLSKEQAKKEVRKLVDSYNQLKSDGKIRKNDEEQIKQHFIEPLFEILGWEMRNPEEVIKEEKVGRKKVDFAFKTNGVTRFFIEAKAQNIDLLDKKVVEQALSYGWNKGITWTILTNFERIFILNCEWKTTGNLLVSRYKTLYHNQFAEDQFENLWILSKESFLEDRLNKIAEKEERKAKRTPVTTQLFQDLTKIRNKLRFDIIKNKPSLKEFPNVIDEAIQRIIDKLIFIRKTEDLGIEDFPLKNSIRLYQSGQLKNLCKRIQEVFVEFDATYNSEMFKPEHLSNTIGISDGAIYEIIKILYSPDERFNYNFSQIDSDILGNIYEQYLALLLKGGKVRGKLEGSKTHRKEQGIYYTPTYIVDYIVKNAIKELLRSNKNIEDIKVLDPACGSGSFLIKALDFIYNERIKNDGKEYQSKLDSGKKARTTLKSDIVKNNLFGVDLDEKAIDIAQLNLLLKTAETRQRLPTLRENIKIGNSLIDDESIERDKAFRWDKKFEKVMGEGGFDIVIGNPPYFNIRINKKLQDYCKKNYPEIYTGQNDVLYYFVVNGLKLLKENGMLGFIVSRYFMESDSAKKFRDYILKNSEILQIIDFGNNQVFEGVNTLTSIIILRKKSKPSKNNIINVVKFPDKTNPQIISSFQNNKEISGVINIKQGNLSSDIWNFYDKDIESIIKKIEKNSFLLKDIAKTGAGIQSGLNRVFVLDEKRVKEFNIEKNLLRNYVKTRDLKPYLIINRKLKVIRLVKEDDIEKYPNTKRYLLKYQKELKSRYEYKKGICKWYSFAVPRNLDVFDSVKEKIITPIYSTSNKFGYDSGKKNERFMTLSDTAVIQIKDKKYSTKAILSILNSNLLNFYYKKTKKLKREGYYEYLSKTLEILPIKYNDTFEKKIGLLVNKIILLKNKLNKMGEIIADEREDLENQVQEINNQINQEVYKLYGLTDKEKKIIEESLK